jgi:hypothetical protein
MPENQDEFGRVRWRVSRDSATSPQGGVQRGDAFLQLLEPVQDDVDLGRPGFDVLKHSEKPRLPFESRDLLPIFRDELGQKLQRHVPAERGVAGPVDGSLPPSPSFSTIS